MRKLFLLLALLPVLAFSQVAVKNLPNGASISNGDFTICDQSGVTNKCTYAFVLSYLQQSLISGTITPGDCTKWVTTLTFGDAGMPCGSGGGGSPPGGSSFSIQFNNSGAFGGVLPGSPGTVCINYATLASAPTLIACPGGSGAFSGITSGTNTTASMLCGTGCTLEPVGSGSLIANGYVGVLGTANGGTGASSLLAASIITYSGAITSGDCAQWLATGVMVDSGAACGTTSTIASGTSALATSLIASGACASAIITSAPGVLTSDAVTWSFSANPTSTVGYQPSASGMLTIISYPTSNNVNYIVCNNTGSSITPGAVTLNWRVVR